MDGYITTVGNFIIQSSEQIITSLKSIYPMAEESQVDSWRTLVDDVKGSNLLHSIPQDCVIAIEYSLPTDGMAVDLILAGRDTSGERIAIIIESKQWSDSWIHAYDFSAYRENDRELHPQVQVSNHKLSFQQYLDIGQNYTVIPVVFMRNCSCNALSYLKSKCPRENCRDIEIRNDINEIIDSFLQLVVSGDECIADELRNAVYSPSIEIIDAMKSIVTKEDPFILTAEQRSVVEQIEKSVLDGKRIIRIFGTAGTGKTAILLNLYIRFLEEKETGNIRPIFISGAQNTALYRSLYPEVERSFTYSYSLKRMVENTKGNLYVILMDEAQHNSPGIITDMVERGCTIILCYDENQTINADNPIEEIHRLEQREDFVSFELKEKMRYNGSQYAEENIRTLLDGGSSFKDDEKYDFMVCDSFDEFQEKVFSTIREHPEETVAVAGLLSHDASDYTYKRKPGSKLFTKWGYKGECKWIPYVYRKEYLTENNGKIWVGTWWLPGLDVDYIAVIIGGDAKLTSNGLVAIPENAKHYNMMVSVAMNMGLPRDLIKERNSYGRRKIDYFKSSKQIIDYINRPENEAIRHDFLDRFSKLLRNNYYITMSRGRKGCFVYFTKREEGA